MEILIGVLVAVVGGALVVALGRGSVRGTERARAREEISREIEGDIQAAAQEISQGRLPAGGASTGAVASLVRAIEQGWAPRHRERAEALEEAIGRVSRFLDRQVRSPLAGVSPEAEGTELRERIDRALGALEDVDFFLRDVGEDRRGTDLVALVQRVSREFATDHEVGVRLQLAAPSVSATIGPEQLMDALYLVLHNAARFGGGSTIDVSVLEEGGRPVVRVRDRGPGFSEEAFRRAFDPFYSESEDGLGLGLPQARKAVEAMGGTVTLRNVPDGGAEVEIALPR